MDIIRIAENAHFVDVPQSISFGLLLSFHFKYSILPLDSPSRHIQDEPSQKLTKNPSVPLFGLAIDDMGFLINGDAQQIIWVPAHLRGGTITVHRDVVVIGGYNGAVTFIRFDPYSW